MDDPVPGDNVELRDAGPAAAGAHPHALAEDVVDVPRDPDGVSGGRGEARVPGGDPDRLLEHHVAEQN